MRKHSLIRTIYLYLFALLGLVLLVIGSVNFINMGLKAFVFTKAEESEKLEMERPPVLYQLERIEKAGAGAQLTEGEVEDVRQMIESYKAWEEQRGKLDYVTASRHRQAATNLALIIVGLPLYFYHWFVIKRETNRKEEDIEKC